MVSLEWLFLTAFKNIYENNEGVSVGLALYKIV